MKLTDALQQWSDSCSAEPASKDGAKFVPADNRRPLAAHLRHCKDADLEVVSTDAPAGWSAVVLVTPAAPPPHSASGGAPLPQPPRRKPFHIFVG